MRRTRRLAVAPAALAAVVLLLGCNADPTTFAILDAAAGASDARLRITYPEEGTLFPPQSVAPTFVWTDETPTVDRWYVVVRDESGIDVDTEAVDAPRWRPSEEGWRRIKLRSGKGDAEVIVAGVDRTNRSRILSSARVHVRTAMEGVALRGRGLTTVSGAAEH